MRQRMQNASSSHSDVLIADSKEKGIIKSSKQRDKSRKKLNMYANVEFHHCKKKKHIKKFCQKFKKN